MRIAGTRKIYTKKFDNEMYETKDFLKVKEMSEDFCNRFFLGVDAVLTERKITMALMIREMKKKHSFEVSYTTYRQNKTYGWGVKSLNFLNMFCLYFKMSLVEILAAAE